MRACVRACVRVCACAHAHIFNTRKEESWQNGNGEWNQDSNCCRWCLTWSPVNVSAASLPRGKLVTWHCSLWYELEHTDSGRGGKERWRKRDEGWGRREGREGRERLKEGEREGKGREGGGESKTSHAANYNSLAKKCAKNPENSVVEYICS